MTIRILLVLATLASAPALHAQPLQPEVLLPSVDTLYTIHSLGGELDTIATAVQSMRRVAVDGRELWEVEYAFSGGTNLRMLDTTRMDASTLLPRTQRRSGGGQRVEVDYDGPEVRLRTLQDGERAPEQVLRLEQPAFAASVMDVVLRALPLEDGYQTRVPLVILPSAQMHWTNVRVTGPHAVESRGQPVEAWRVEAGAEGEPPDVLWIARSDRMLLRVDSPGGLVTIR